MNPINPNIAISVGFLMACYGLYWGRKAETKNGSPVSSMSLSSPWLWVAAFWALIVFPVGCAHFSYLWPYVPDLFNHGDRRGWFGFWGGVAFYEWMGVILCLLALRFSRWSLSTIGLDFKNTNKFLMTLVGLLGVFAIWIYYDPTGHMVGTPENLTRFAKYSNQTFGQTTVTEQWVWLATSFTAGICEEILYRGLLLRFLERWTGNFWFAAGLSSFAFTYMHGGFTQSYLVFMTRMIFAIGFTYLAVSKRSLAPGIVIHFTWDAVYLMR